ncbi:MAG: hypothetical protein WDZ28_04595 [Simkaniaceae bacterium]
MKHHFLQLNYFIIFGLFLISCQGWERTEKDRIKKVNEVSSRVYRYHFERYAEETPLLHRIRERYPFEEKMIGLIPKITKEHFRCRGSSHNPIQIKKNQQGNAYSLVDCGGIEQHSLPVEENSEKIYPILIDLLNNVQKETNRRVIVTCGHRCPIHNAYSDQRGKNLKSKHLIGAEVDFYVQGYEESPREIIDILLEYDKDQEYGLFYYALIDGVATWQNKEVRFSLFQKNQGRDFDNRHPYSYITIELLYDRSENKRVYYTWHRSFNGYLRW